MPTPTPTPGERPREVRTLNFDLSWGEFTDLQLHVLNSSSDRVPKSVHDDETRAQFRELIPALQDVPDELLTHFAEDVDLPSDALQLVW